MKEEFERLYDKWYWTYCVSSIISLDVLRNQEFWDFANYCKEHKEEALKIIEEKLENEISYLYIVMPYLAIDDSMIDDYFDILYNAGSMEQMCNTWLNFLKNTTGVDYYIEYREYEKYLNENYISWDPRVEDDPNVTYQEFKRGLRNEDK